MVTITDYVRRENTDGKEFIALIVQGGLEVVKSKEGHYYATAKKASIPSTFSEAICQSLIGEKLPGSIVRMETEAYEFALPETGEVITLSHRWQYMKETESIEETVLESVHG